MFKLINYILQLVLNSMTLSANMTAFNVERFSAEKPFCASESGKVYGLSTRWFKGVGVFLLLIGSYGIYTVFRPEDGMRNVNPRKVSTVLDTKLQDSRGITPTALGVSKQPSSLVERALRLYVAEVPEKFFTGVSGKGLEEINRQYGHGALGKIWSPRDKYWLTPWHQVDAYWTNLVSISPLRTYDVEQADMIYVPTLMRVGDTRQYNAFIEEAPSFLPWLAQKPHVMVLNHAVSVFHAHSKMLQHPNAAHFTFLTLGLNAPAIPNGSVENQVAAPQFGPIHWSRGSEHFIHPKPFNETAILEKKTILAAEAFNVRSRPDRPALYAACKGRPKLCVHHNFTGNTDAIPILHDYARAWFCPMVQGDFISRSAWFDCLLVGSIPVVFQDNYMRSVPFMDVFDFKRMSLYLPKELLLGDNSTNIFDVLKENFEEFTALDRLAYTLPRVHVFQYSLNPREEDVVLWGEENLLHPEDDAYTFTLKAVMRNACARGMLPKRCKLRG